MPTGYTAGIEDGKITTGKDFLKLCTRAFGIAMNVRDEPLSVPTPTKFEPSTYYKDRFEEAKAQLEKCRKMSFEEAKTKMIKSHEDRVKMYKSIAERYIENNKKYAKVRAEVETWIPPTLEHYNLKRFALEQIDMCIEKQEYIDECLQKANEKLDDSDKAVDEFISREFESCYEDLKRAKENWEEEQARAASKNAWMENFLNSLK